MFRIPKVSRNLSLTIFNCTTTMTPKSTVFQCNGKWAGYTWILLFFLPTYSNPNTSYYYSQTRVFESSAYTENKNVKFTVIREKYLSIRIRHNHITNTIILYERMHCILYFVYITSTQTRVNITRIDNTTSRINYQSWLRTNLVIRRLLEFYVWYENLWSACYVQLLSSVRLNIKISNNCFDVFNKVKNNS